MRRKTLMIRHHMLRAALFLLLLVSPIGAPALGIFITAACSKDVAATADGPFAMGFSRCGLPLPIEHFYQSSRSEEHTSELQSLMRISYAVFCLKKTKQTYTP